MTIASGTTGPTTLNSGVRPQDQTMTVDEEYLYWRERSRVVLSPTAAPSVLGLFGFSAATLMVASYLAGWWGTALSPVYLAPFALVFGGIAQFLAGMWSYKARDTLATAIHGMWGSFWIAWGILWLLHGTGTLPFPAGASHYWTAFGMWFVMLGLLTGIGFFAAIAKNLALATTLGLLSAGSCLLAVAFITGSTGWKTAGGWVLVASVGAAVYTAAALLFSDTYGRTILPLLEFSAKKNIPGSKIMRPIEYPQGQPGVRHGQ